MKYLTYLINLSILSLLICHVFSHNAHAINKRDSKNQPLVCDNLCDSARIDTISPLHIDDQQTLLIIRGLCVWDFNMNRPSSLPKSGRRHPFMYETLESAFTIYDDTNKPSVFNMTGLFTSGMSYEVLRSNGNNELKSVERGPIPFPGLKQNYQTPIDAAFEWQKYHLKYVYLIQGMEYYAYDLIGNRQVLASNFNNDFGLNPDVRIRSAFVTGESIYLFSDANFYVYQVNHLDPGTGRFSGTLSHAKDTKSDFLKCGSKGGADPGNPMPTGGTNVSDHSNPSPSGGTYVHPLYETTLMTIFISVCVFVSLYLF